MPQNSVWHICFSGKMWDLQKCLKQPKVIWIWTVFGCTAWFYSSWLTFGLVSCGNTCGAISELVQLTVVEGHTLTTWEWCLLNPVVRSFPETDGNNTTWRTSIYFHGFICIQHQVITEDQPWAENKATEIHLCYIIFQTGIASVYKDGSPLDFSWLSAIHLRSGVVISWGYLWGPIPFPFDL